MALAGSVKSVFTMIPGRLVLLISVLNDLSGQGHVPIPNITAPVRVLLQYYLAIMTKLLLYWQA